VSPRPTRRLRTSLETDHEQDPGPEAHLERLGVAVQVETAIRKKNARSRRVTARVPICDPIRPGQRSPAEHVLAVVPIGATLVVATADQPDAAVTERAGQHGVPAPVKAPGFETGSRWVRSRRRDLVATDVGAPQVSAPASSPIEIEQAR
jgi:hypothetical protein